MHRRTPSQTQAVNGTCTSLARPLLGKRYMPLHESRSTCGILENRRPLARPGGPRWKSVCSRSSWPTCHPGGFQQQADHLPCPFGSSSRKPLVGLLKSLFQPGMQGSLHLIQILLALQGVEANGLQLDGAELLLRLLRHVRGPRQPIVSSSKSEGGISQHRRSEPVPKASPKAIRVLTQGASKAGKRRPKLGRAVPRLVEPTA